MACCYLGGTRNEYPYVGIQLGGRPPISYVDMNICERTGQGLAIFALFILSLGAALFSSEYRSWVSNVWQGRKIESFEQATEDAANCCLLTTFLCCCLATLEKRYFS